MHVHARSRSCRPALAAVAAMLVALVLVPVAGAHARLITTEPANDAVLEQSPRSVLLRFDDPVETAFGAIRVYDARARRVDSGEVERPSDREARDRSSTGASPVARTPRPGVSCRPTVIPSRARSSSTSALPVRTRREWRRRCSEDGTPTSVSVLFSIVRALDFLLLLLVGGGTLMLVVGLGQAAPRTRSRMSLLLAGAALLAGARCGRGDRAAGRGRGGLRAR